MMKSKPFRIRLSMSGRNASGHVSFKRTVTEAEFLEIARLVLGRDGARPWENEPETVPGGVRWQ